MYPTSYTTIQAWFSFLFASTPDQLLPTNEAYEPYRQGQYFASRAQQQAAFELHDAAKFHARNAIWNFLNSALRGCAEAQYTLGICYLNADLGLKLDSQQANYWLKQAAAQNYLPAIEQLQQLPQYYH